MKIVGGGSSSCGGGSALRSGPCQGQGGRLGGRLGGGGRQVRDAARHHAGQELVGRHG